MVPRHYILSFSRSFEAIDNVSLQVGTLDKASAMSSLAKNIFSYFSKNE